VANKASNSSLFAGGPCGAASIDGREGAVSTIRSRADCDGVDTPWRGFRVQAQHSDARGRDADRRTVEVAYRPRLFHISGGGSMSGPPR
jgi:hypothetical protein